VVAWSLVSADALTNKLPQNIPVRWLTEQQRQILDPFSEIVEHPQKLAD
jgi:hypothetical protein